MLSYETEFQMYGSIGDAFNIYDDNGYLEDTYYLANALPSSPDLSGVPTQSSIPSGYTEYRTIPWGTTCGDHNVYIISNGSKCKGYINNQWWDLNNMSIPEDGYYCFTFEYAGIPDYVYYE